MVQKIEKLNYDLAHNERISFELKMAAIAYYRVSTADQSVESQRHAMTRAAPQGFDEEFLDEGISGAVPAADRPAFSKLLAFVRKGDVLYVYAVDRLGRDALDVQSTVRALLERGVAVEVLGLGRIARGVGELILAVLAQVADMERNRISERTAAGRAKARDSLLTIGVTHRGKASLGRPLGRVAGASVDPKTVVSWKFMQQASISATAAHWGISTATVKRYCAAHSSR